MKQFVLAAIALFVASIAIPQTAGAYIESTGITNKTDKSAWITVYYSSPASPWSIYPGTPHCLKAGESVGWGINKKSEIKIRAEVKANADCSGPNIADTYDVRKTGITSQPSHPTARLQLDGNAYHVWFY